MHAEKIDNEEDEVWISDISSSKDEPLELDMDWIDKNKTLMKS